LTLERRTLSHADRTRDGWHLGALVLVTTNEPSPTRRSSSSGHNRPDAFYVCQGVAAGAIDWCSSPVPSVAAGTLTGVVVEKAGSA
jgi:hypothetical protein